MTRRTVQSLVGPLSIVPIPLSALGFKHGVDSVLLVQVSVEVCGLGEIYYISQFIHIKKVFPQKATNLNQKLQFI